MLIISQYLKLVKRKYRMTIICTSLLKIQSKNDCEKIDRMK